MSGQQHTPRPWEAVPQPDNSWLLKRPTQYHRMGGVVAAERATVIGRIYRQADAEHILHVLNCHKSLLKACESLIDLVQRIDRVGELKDDSWLCDPDYESAVAIIARIRGEVNA